jgi:transcriptional regulator with GAF, ATPase, and Fis domain
MINLNKSLVGVAFITLLLILSFIFSDFIKQADENILTSKFRIRGESAPDSSVIILYLDNDDIRAIGGWPIKRNYYALVIKVLNELGAKVIGLDIALINPNVERPEYDDLLTNVVKSSGNVVLVGYFTSLTKDEPNLKSRLPEKTGYHTEEKVYFYTGEKLNLPFPKLLDAAGGIGHKNFYNFKVPVFIRSANKVFPAFSFELLRIFSGAEKSSVNISSTDTRLISESKIIQIPYEKDGTINVNYPGGVSTLNAIPLVEFLQAYSLQQKGGITDVDVNQVKNKIVIVGVIAEGMTDFVETPYTKQFPAVGIQAAIIANALNNDFLKIFPDYWDFIFVFAVGLFFIYLILKLNDLKGLLILLAFLVSYSILSYSVFIIFDYEIPVARMLFVQIFLTIGLLIYKHQVIKETVYKLESERSAIFKKLREREDKLIKLEKELQNAEQKNAAEQTAYLREEINKYKEGLRLLSSEAVDINVYNISDKPKLKPLNFENIIYTQSGPMNNVVEFVKKIADNDSAVLILGESGTGKELIARAIHRSSKRKEKPFIAVNCGALSETLLESELFGHEKGAFTGAVKDKPGRFELADGGTIFLDEVAETSEAFQVKLLRVLQEGELERVGGTETIRVNVRVVAATNQNLVSSSGSQKLRQDLYYRLGVFVINLPPLRDRKVDIPVLAEYLVNMEDPKMKISTNVVDVFSKYSWHGNIRELHSVIKRAVILAKSEGRDIIRSRDLPEEIKSLIENTGDIADQIIESLRNKKFSKSAISETAKELEGLNRGTVSEYLRGYCFKTFVEQDMNIESTITTIAGISEPDTIQRVRKKLLEFISNAVELVDNTKKPEENILVSKPKFKNLPQKYHYYLEKIITDYQK